MEGSGTLIGWLLCLVLICNSSQSIGLLLAAVVPDPAITIALSPVAMIPFMLVTGFFLNLQSIPPYLLWLTYISPHKYVFAAMMQNQFGSIVSHSSHHHHSHDTRYCYCSLIDLRSGLGWFGLVWFGLVAVTAM